MINFNGTILENVNQLSLENRGYKWGDALFETLKVVNSKILFWEDHYFRLMASMRILRMKIPMTFTMEFLEQEILKTIAANNLNTATIKVRLNIDRGVGGEYFPKKQDINYSIVTKIIAAEVYHIPEVISYTVDLFKDYFKAPGLLSNLNTNNKNLQVLAGIYAQENDLDNCIVMNTNKQVIEAINGNLFLVQGTTIKTPPLEDGCVKGILRQQVIAHLKQDEDYELLETAISPFELQKADELFITNVIQGIQPITSYRKKSYDTKVSRAILQKLNAKLT